MPERPLRSPTPFRGVLHPSPRADALREYADRWHVLVVEHDTICRCGASVGEDGCSERQQLLADADAIEQGRDFEDVAYG